MQQNNIEEYKYSLDYAQIFDLLIGIGLISLGSFILSVPEKLNLSLLVLIIVLYIIGFTPFLIFINHLIYSLESRIKINYTTKKIEHKYKYKSQIFSFDEIESVEIHESINIRFLAFSFSYAKYFTKSGNLFIVSSLMSHYFFIPDRIKPNYIEHLFPFINKKKEKEEKEKMKSDYELLQERYNDLTTKKLEDIANSKSGYRISAIIAAKKVLKKRLDTE